MDEGRFVESLKRHEGIELKPYKDTVGVLTIGIGRNLDDVGITEMEAEMLLRNDITAAKAECRLLIDCYDDLDDIRQEVICNMLFNLGRPRLSQFKRMLAALDARDFEKAADEAKDSRWFVQVKGRGRELCWQLRHGEVGTVADWEGE